MWKSPGDRYRNQIYYIMCLHCFRNTNKQVKTYPGPDIGSDHNPVVMKVAVKLGKMRKVSSRHHLDMNLLKNEEYRNLYHVKVNNMNNNNTEGSETP